MSILNPWFDSAGNRTWDLYQTRTECSTTRLQRWFVRGEKVNNILIIGSTKKYLCLVRYIFYGFNVKVYIRASKKVGFQLPKSKGEITTLYTTLTVK